MPFSASFMLITVALVLVVFWVVRRGRGLLYALAASSITFVFMAAVFFILITLITSRMP